METAASLVKEAPETVGNVEEPIPTGFGRGYRGVMSTQQIFGLVLTDISRNVAGLSERLVTASPDVASSTNLGGWINKAGVWSRHEREPVPEEQIPRALQWVESRSGQHIELGISENNLFMLLGQLGPVARGRGGDTVSPRHALRPVREAWAGTRSCTASTTEGKFILVGTPSGVTLGPEGGAHQSVITPSIGVAFPELAYYEPCFGQELEWILLAAAGEDPAARRSRLTCG